MIGRRLATVLLAGVAAASLLHPPAAGAGLAPKNVDLSKAFDFDCVGGAFKPLVEGSCGSRELNASSPWGPTFVAEKFPRGRLTLSGVPFTLGDTTGRAMNAASGAGQVVRVAAPRGFRWAHLLVMACLDGSRSTSTSGKLTVSYAGGAKITSPIKARAWDEEYDAGTAAIVAPAQNITSVANTSLEVPRYVWVLSVPINARRPVTSLMLSSGGVNLRVFAITLSASPAHPTKPWTPAS